MSFRRESGEAKWQRFIDLLPDKERRIELTPVLNACERTGCDMDLAYLAIANGLKAQREEEAAHKTLSEKEAKAYVRKIRRIGARLEKEEDFAELDRELDEDRKTAFRIVNKNTTDPWELVKQDIREAKETVRSEILPRIGRPQGEQPHTYAGQADEDLQAARIGSRQYRDDLLRPFNLKPHAES